MFNLLKRSKKKANKNVVASATSDDSDCHVRGALSDDEFDQSTRGYYRILNDENVRLEKDINNEEKYKYYVSQPFVGRESSSGIQRTKDKDDTAKLLGRKERNKSAKIDKNDGKESFRNKQSSKKNDNHKDLDCIEKKLEDNHSRKGFFNLGRKSKTHFPRKEEEKVEKNAQNSQNPSDSYTTHNLSPLETNYNVNVDKSFKPLDKVKGSPYKEFSKARNPRFGFNDSEKIPLFAGKDNVSELKHKAYLTEFDDLDDLDTNDLSVEKASTSRNFENEICFEAKGNDENLANILNEESTYLGTAINSDSQAKDVTSEAAKILLTDSNSAINLNTKQAEMKKKLKSEKNTSLSAAVISSSDTDEIFSAQNEVLMVEEKFSHLVANNDRTNAESLKTNRRFDFNLWQGHTSSNENSQLFINNTCQTNKNNNYQEVEEANNSLKVKDVANNFNDDDDKTSGDSELSLPANKVKDNSNRIFEKCCTIGATTIAILDLEVPKIKEEVKLRNSHSSIENKSNESKRQSRLSLTLSGFSLSSGKCKSSRAGSDDIIKNLKTNNQELKKRTSLFSKAKSESLERSDVETTNLNPFPEAGTNDSDIPKSSRKRWTFKHQRSSSLESKFPETTKEILDAKKNSIQRSKDFISDIFMARGRNNNRNRNHPQANQQQPCKYASNDNKQPKNNFNNEQKKAKYQPTNATPTTISKLVSGTNDSMQSSRNDQDHLHCNMHGNGATSSNKSRNVMNQNGNFSNKYDRDSVNKTNISSINTDTNSEKLHLEENVKVDPSATAETYQMTMSINRNKNICQIDSTTDSNKKNANFAFGRNLKDKRQMQNDYQTLHHQQDLNRCQTRQQMKSQEPPKDAVQYQANQRRSNSAEQIRDSPKKPKDDQLLLQHIANQRRSNSADEMRVPQHHSNINPTTVVHSTEVNKELENHAKDEHSENENFTHARNIEVRSTSVPDSSSDTEKRLSKSFACFATTSSPERVSEGKSLRSQETQETEETKTKTKQTEKESENENEQEKETETEKEAEAESSYGKQELNDLTECNDRNSVFLSKEFDDQNIDENPLKHQEGEELNEQEENIITMGQTNGKPESSQNSNSTRQNVQQAFRESQINSPINIQRQKSPVIVPTITVQDYSGQMDKSRHFPNSSEQEVFYDSENDSKLNDIHINSLPEKDVDGAFDFDEVDEVFAGGSSSSNGPLNFNGKWSSCHGHGLRFNHIKLENVPEESDAEEAAEKGNIYFKNKTSEENNLTKKDNNGNEPIFNESAREDDSEEEDREDDDDEDYSDHNNLDNETYANNFSPERSPLKSTNTSDSNLSTSFPDSGIGDSHCSSRTPLHSDSEPRQQSPKQQNQHSSHNLPFVRDGNSTDCDETLLQYDDLEYHPPFNSRISEERLVCIESISLPDVVVESTNSSSSSNTSINQNTYPSQTHSKHSKKTFDNIYDNVNNNDDDDDDGEHIININSGASSNNMGNVHFIPIHVESSSRNKKTESSLPKSSAFSTNNCQKRRSIDDSFLGSSSNSKNSSSSHHQQQHMPTIEIIEDENGKTIEFGGYEIETEKLKRELNNQKSKFSLQLDDAHKNVQNLQNKVEDMQTKIEKLEVELSTKTWNVERLQSELSAAHKDDEYVRKKLKILEDEKTILRHKISENEDEYKKKYEELEVQYNELDEKFQQSQKLATNLQAQVAAAQTEAEESRNELKMIRSELEEQIRILKNALENSEAERKICEDRWQKEFEMLRTHNIDREETIMTDCEWQLRQTQKQCKDRLDKSDHARQEALEKAKLLETELEDKKKKISDLKIYQAQMNSLRGVVQEQEHSIHTLMEQIKNLKADLETANENLKDQIDAVRKIKIHCDNAIYDKERQMIYRIDEVRHEAAAFWEDKLYTEMTRLKNELESVYIDERREALDKLQAEHIEELRALTTRYTANEDELQIELSELQEQLQRKGQEFLDLREKSDNALLQTRMHLDRADREYQNAMCREEEKREALELSLKKEFEDEKQDMEEKFRERLNQVKDEFAKELQITRQEMTQEHKKHLENQKAKLRAEKEEALQELADRHRKKLAAAEDRIKDIELRHQRDLKDLKAAYDAEKAALDKRDISNANEIEQLHRKCRCLTNLFEEMRMRYERRDPRPEDLREIAELRTRCESQERDLYVLTDRLREMQIDMSEMQQQKQANNDVRKGKAVKKPPPKTIPTNCDVIYEENEERDSPPPVPLTPRDDDEDEDAESRDETVQKDTSNNKFERMMESRGDEKNVQINKNHINENDSRLITAL